MKVTKSDKMIVAELFLEEPLKNFLRREYRLPDETITSLTKKLNKITGQNIERSTIWKWMKLFNIKRKIWR